VPPAPQESERPRIFGMTASPLDTKAKSSGGYIEIFFVSLERSLDAQVACLFLPCLSFNLEEYQLL